MANEPVREFFFRALLAYVVGGDVDECCERTLVTTYRRATGRTPEEAMSAMVASIEENNPPYENTEGEIVQIRYIGILDAIDAATLDEDEVWCDVRTECCNVNALATGLTNAPTLLDKLR